MTDFQKNITVVLFGAFLSIGGTFMANVLVIGERITSINKSVIKIDNNVEKLKIRMRLFEIEQARMLAAN